MAQQVCVILVLIAGDQPVDALDDQHREAVGDLRGVAVVMKASGDAVAEADPVVELAQRQKTGVGTDPTRFRISVDFFVLAEGESRLGGALCTHGRSLQKWSYGDLTPVALEIIGNYQERISSAVYVRITNQKGASRFMATKSVFRAHSRSSTGHEDPVATHLRLVSKRAARYAAAFSVEEDAKIAGLLHDLGKYGERFQRRLEGLVRNIDHWSPGAWACVTKCGLAGVGPALAIQGHHVGLQAILTTENLRSMDPQQIESERPEGRRPSAVEVATLLERARSDEIEVPPASTSPVYQEELRTQRAALMLDVRMLFSTLVDADFIETEAHFNATGPDAPAYRAPGPDLDPSRAKECLRSYIERLSAASGAPDHVRQLRDDLLQSCRAAAESEAGLFTLTAPTGAGKTLSMLSFALRHAREHGLQRIIAVLPYLSIIDQTVQEYQKALKSVLGEAPNYIIEDHSLARPPEQEADDGEKHARLLAENWDAPIVITTSVQMLESLMSNRPRACRKLHRLAKSVILFDEVQTLPIELAIPTLATLSRLSERYGSTVVFSTATQPAFEHLHEGVRRYCAAGWNPREIVSNDLDLFGRARRTTVQWPEDRTRRDWPKLAEELAAHHQVLCVTNLKRHALALFDELSSCMIDDIFHLSTSMCPAHRREVLADVDQRLKDHAPCRLVSTQCVEAGVDIDFPVAYRALAPLDSIAQAAGRCNREGKAANGDVHVFVPADDRLYPGGGYRQAAHVTMQLLREQEGNLDIHDPEVFDRYYRSLYDLKDLSPADDRSKEQNPLLKAVNALDFEQLARLYRLIDKNTINVLVPYDEAAFEELAAEVLSEGLSREWITAARPYSVGVYQPRDNHPIQAFLEYVPVVQGREYSRDWAVYRGEYYCDERGLVPPQQNFVIA